jgi:crossover junction endodeoxyribonuclease RuvC
VIQLCLAQHHFDVTQYSPNEVKQSVTSYGNAQKKQVQEMVRVLLNLEAIPKPDDAADALAIALCHLSSLRYRNLLSSK